VNRTAALLAGILAVGAVACSAEPARTGDTTLTTVTATTPPSAPATTAAPTAAPTTAPAPTTPPTTPPTIDELLALGRPLVLAHTGGEDAYPGGTMYGFGESMAAGVDILDFNVLLTADGEVVVQHDLTVDRTTNGTGDVASMTLAELSALDNAYWFTPDCGTCKDKPDSDYVFRGVRTGEVPPPDGYTADDFAIATLAEVVERFPTAALGAEIKGEGELAQQVAVALAAELQRLDRVDSAVVSSFDDAALATFHELLPTVPLSPGLQLTTGWVLNRTPLPDGYSILQLPPEFSGLQLLTPELIADSTAAGYPIWVWPNDRTLENKASYRAFLDAGITGLNINFPAEGVQAVNEFEADGGLPLPPTG
jgi:glycerophosphoryl diester phosphodiesterase